jgi:hypothetical protein
MPPKPRKRRGPPTNQFFFVNQDASTVPGATKDAELDREKQSHVQRQNYARRQLQKDKTALQQADPAELGFEALSEPAKRAGSGSEQPPEASEARNESESLEYDPVTPANAALDAEIVGTGPFFQHNDPPVSHDPSPTRELPYRALEATQLKSSTALNNPLRASFSHPILGDSTSLLSKWAPPLLQYWVVELVPEKFYHDTRCVPLAATRHAAAVHNELRTAMSHPAHMYSLLATVSIQMVQKEGTLKHPSQPTTDTENTHMPTFFKTKALHAVREELAKGNITHDMVFDIHRLMGASYFAEAYETAIPHHHAILNMISSLGGHEAFDEYFNEFHILMHWSASLRRLVPPPYATESFDPGRGTPEIQELVRNLHLQSTDTMTSAFPPLVAREVLQPKLANIASDLADVLRLENYIAHPGRAYVAERFRYVDTRHVALGYTLLHLPVYENVVNEAVRIALVFCVALTRSPESGRRCASKAVWMLRALLKRHTGTLAGDHGSDDGEQSDGNVDKLWRPYTACLLWVSVVGGMTARSKSTSTLPSMHIHAPTISALQPAPTATAMLYPPLPELSPWTSPLDTPSPPSHQHTTPQGSYTAAANDESMFFAALAHKCCVELGITSLPQLETLLATWIYEPGLMRVRLREVWGRICAVN